MSPEIGGLIILVIGIALYISEIIPAALTSILLCFLMVLFNFAPSEVAFGGFINDTNLLILGLSVIGISIVDSGLSELIGSKLYRVSKGNYSIIAILLIFFCMVVSAFLNNTSAVIMVLPILQSLEVVSKGKFHTKEWLIPLAIAAGVGGMFTLIGSTPQLIVQSQLIENNLQTFGFFEFSKIAFPIMILYFLYIKTIGNKLAVKLWHDDRIVPDEAEVFDFKPIKLDKNQIINLVIFLGTVIAIVLSDSLDFINISLGMIALTGAFLAIIVGHIEFETVLQEVDLDSFLILGASIGFAAALEYSNSAQYVTYMMLDLIGPNNPYMLFVLVVILTNVFSQFMSNTGISGMMVYIGLTLASVLHVNPMTFMAAIVFAASISFATPLASPPMTLVFKPGGFKFKDYIKYSLPFNVLCIVAIIILIPIFWPL